MITVTSDDKHFEMVRGDDVYITLPIAQAAVAHWRMAGTKNGPAMVDKSSGNGISVISSKHVVHLIPVDTAAFTPGRYYYEARGVENGDVTTVLQGVVTMHADMGPL